MCYAQRLFAIALLGIAAGLMTCRSTFSPGPAVARGAASWGRFGVRREVGAGKIRPQQGGAVSWGRFGVRRGGLAVRSVGFALLAQLALLGLVHPADPLDLPVRTIGGEDLMAPAALPAGAFLIVGFKRRSLDETKPWREALEALGASAPPVFSLYVLEAAPRWVRWMIVRATKRDASPEEYGSILVAAQDEAGWRSLVGFQAAREDAAYVVRFDASGQPCFRYAGPVTDEALHSGLVADCAL